MIHQGSNGSINFFYKNRMVISRPLNEFRTVDDYWESANKTIIEGLYAGWSLPALADFHLDFIKKSRYNKFVREPTSKDLDLILNSGLTLIKLKKIDPNGSREGLLICDKKRKSRHSKI